MFAIYKKELRNYFTTPIGYVFCGVFLAVSGLLFGISTLIQQTSDVSGFFQIMIFGYIVIVPLLTMRSFAEEKRTKTDQLLFTSPVSVSGMVLGKFFAAFTMFAGTVLVSTLYYIPVVIFSADSSSGIATQMNVNVGKAAGCLIAMLLLGMCFISVGIFVSTLTESIVAAATGTMAILLGFVGVGLFNSLIDSYVLRSVLSWLSVYSRYGNFAIGQFDIAATVYYISITSVFLFLAVRVCERRRYA